MKQSTTPMSATHPAVFRKAKVLAMRQYANRHDLLSVLLEHDKLYTLDQVDGLIHDFLQNRKVR